MSGSRTKLVDAAGRLVSPEEKGWGLDPRTKVIMPDLFDHKGNYIRGYTGFNLWRNEIAFEVPA